MKSMISNIKVGTKLTVAFTFIFLFFISMGIFASYQTNQLKLQTEDMYKHLLQVRRSLQVLDVGILNMRIGLKDLMLASNNQETQAALQLIEINATDVEKQFDIIKAKYIGAPKDIEEAFKAYTIWRVGRDQNIKLAMIGKIEQVKESSLPGGIVGILRENMFASIKKIDESAKQKGDILYSTTLDLSNTLNRWLIILTVSLSLFILIIGYSLLQMCRKPLEEMNNAVVLFHKGNIDSRSLYESKNEFGVLSSSINNLLDLAQQNTILNERTEIIATEMMSEEDDKKFFHALLGKLVNYTEAQMAAVYLLSIEKNTFDYFDSIGMDESARKPFDANHFEGEFGPALFSGKLQHIQDLPEETRFEFRTVNGKLIPREIITIPIHSGDQIIAIISLASTNRFSKLSVDLINRMLAAISARIEGILAFRSIKEYKDTLETQNQELNAQRKELSAQTKELIHQNVELEMQKKQLKEASQHKTNFLTNMSHELRTPLNSVIALSEVLSRRLANKIPEEEFSYLEIIERNGKNLLLLINDILDISRIEGGHEEIMISEFNPNNVISEIVFMVQPQAEQSKVIILHESKGGNLRILSDVDKFHHILQNLIGNAVKFTESGIVTIIADQDENATIIKISDTGIGIPEDQLQTIFDEFRQADGSISRKFGGTGLGLAIAKKYANLLGGSISVISTINEGSEFTLSLPLVYIDFENKISLHQSVNISSSTRVLLVEDNESAIIQIKDLIEDIGCEVEVASDGGEALESIFRELPNAIILDLMMPGIDGFKMLEILWNKEETAHIPVLILTSKLITSDDLKFLKHSNIHQLIQKGNVNRAKFQNAVTSMLYPDAGQAISEVLNGN